MDRRKAQALIRRILTDQIMTEYYKKKKYRTRKKLTKEEFRELMLNRKDHKQ